MRTPIEVTSKGATRWARGHPWIYASDVVSESGPPGVAPVIGPRGKPLGQALYSPKSEIRLRLLESRGDVAIDHAWWVTRIQAALDRRAGIDATAYRVVHAEGDGLPSLVIDRYDRWVVAQLLSAGLEARRAEVLEAIAVVLEPDGVLLRNDQRVRLYEGLEQGVELARGLVPESVAVREAGISYFAAPWTGQKTGAFLDQRPNRIRAGALMPEQGRGLDCF